MTASMGIASAREVGRELQPAGCAQRYRQTSTTRWSFQLEREPQVKSTWTLLQMIRVRSNCAEEQRETSGRGGEV